MSVHNMAAAFVDGGATRDPDGTALLSGNDGVTYGALSTLVARAAGAWREAGCSRGDRVVLALPDSVMLIAAFYGAVKIGAVPAVVSPAASRGDFAHYLAELEPRAVVAHGKALPALSEAAEASSAMVMPAGAHADGWPGTRWETLLEDVEPCLRAQTVAEHDPAAIVYTSGSTGLQKPVVHSHRSFVRAARAVAAGVYGLGAGDTVLSLPRLTFSFGQGFGMHFPIANGASAIVTETTPDPVEVAQLVERHRPSILVAVPGALAALMGAVRRGLSLDVGSLRCVLSAGEPLSEALWSAYRRTFGIEILDGIGSTEMMTHFIGNRPGQARPSSLGTAMPGCEIELRDDDGAQVADGEIGALWIRSDYAFLEYWGQPEPTARARVDGWFGTGDQLSRDRDGHYRYCGRGDDMLKVSGQWASSSEIETRLSECPGVDRAVVTTKEHPSGTRRLVAYIVPARDTRVEALELLRHLGAALPPHLLPTTFVPLAELPLTSNGKIARHALPAPRW